MKPIANHSPLWLAGSIADLPTPFDDNDAIDFAAFERLCERQIEAGAKAIVVAETAGEVSTLTLAEHDAIVRTAVKVAGGRCRFIAGAGANANKHAVGLARRAGASRAGANPSVGP